MSEIRGEPIPVREFIYEKLEAAHGKFGSIANPYWLAAEDRASQVEYSMKLHADPDNRDISKALEHVYAKIKQHKNEMPGYEEAAYELEDDIANEAREHFRGRKSAHPEGDIHLTESIAYVELRLVKEVKAVSDKLTQEKSPV